MLATVPKRCRSIAAGSAISASRCIRTPIWRCSRTACWAAAIERGRPTVIGATMPGNNTIRRTGTMIIASGGSGGVGRGCSSAIGGLRFAQCDDQAAVGGGARAAAIAAGGEPDAPLKPTLRQLDAMDDSRAQLRRQHAGARDHQVRAIDDGLDLVDAPPRQGEEQQRLALGLENIDRRLPGPWAARLKELAMQAFGPGERVARLGPHPVKVSIHSANPRSAGPKCVDWTSPIQSQVPGPGERL